MCTMPQIEPSELSTGSTLTFGNHQSPGFCEADLLSLSHEVAFAGW